MSYDSIGEVVVSGPNFVAQFKFRFKVKCLEVVAGSSELIFCRWRIAEQRAASDRGDAALASRSAAIQSPMFQVNCLDLF